jgi:hypothetical protein
MLIDKIEEKNPTKDLKKTNNKKKQRSNLT